MTTYIAHRPPHPSRQYRGLAGDEPSKLRLPWHVLDSLGRTIPASLPDEYDVIGEWRHEDGRVFLDFAVTTAYIEATTNLRYDQEHAKLREFCQECELWGGRHTKSCSLA